MNRKDPFTTTEMEMIVGYFDLDFHFPIIWTSSLGWKSSDESVEGYINQSICGAKRRNTSLKRQDNNELETKNELDQLLLEEMKRSAKFEAALKAAVDGECAYEASTRSAIEHREMGPADEDSHNEEKEVFQSNGPRSSRYYYVPVVSYLSPTLGLYAASSPTTLKQRVEVYDNKHIREISITPGSKRQRLQENRSSHKYIGLSNASTYTHSKSGIIRTLRDSVEKDMDESEAFDKKLQEALIVD